MYYNMNVHLESMSVSYRKSVYGWVFSQTAKIQRVTNSIFFLSAVYLYHKNKIWQRQYWLFRNIATAINIRRKTGRKLLSWMWALSACKIFNNIDTQMVRVKLQSACLLEMNEAIYDSEILFQLMRGVVFRHYINYTSSPDKDFPLKKKHKDYTNHQSKKKKILLLKEKKKMTESN